MLREGLFLPLRLLDESVAIGIEQLLEVGYLLSEVLTYVGICHEHAAIGHLHNLGGTLDVGASLDGILHTGKWLVLNQLESTGVIYQGVAGDARLIMVCLGESAVDDHQLAVRLDRVLALGGAHGHVAIDDVAVRTGNAKFVHDVVDDLLLVAQQEVVALLLLVGLLVGDEVALKGGHLALVKERAVGSTPQVEEVVDGILLLLP